MSPRSSAANDIFGLVNLEKLRRASLHELRVRAAQRVSAFSERRGWSDLVKLPSDNVFAVATHEPTFFASFKNPEQTVAEFKSRWPETAQRLIEKADRVCDGKFDLLGF